MILEISKKLLKLIVRMYHSNKLPPTIKQLKINLSVNNNKIKISPMNKKNRMMNLEILRKLLLNKRKPNLSFNYLHKKQISYYFTKFYSVINDLYFKSINGKESDYLKYLGIRLSETLQPSSKSGEALGDIQLNLS